MEVRGRLCSVTGMHFRCHTKNVQRCRVNSNSSLTLYCEAWSECGGGTLGRNSTVLLSEIGTPTAGPTCGNASGKIITTRTDPVFCLLWLHVSANEMNTNAIKISPSLVYCCR